ncbi:M23 family metallopeptidase [Brevundimonas diminuta]|uniref:M23 family metallopeptidase n=1 Tax=Brevundimonas diminuta TaxID=293 RepID=UPI0022AF073B|nr:M23 family metallopeptidase [Brevundimonas diminuta]MCZ4108568.1 M23 family metallopeptidase [Brevundimonas diminuta]
MADLSRQNQRRGAQDRITENRDAVMPTRREDRVPDVQVRADLRSANRASGQSDAINKFFRQLEGATDAYLQHDLADRRVKAEEAYADGMADASAGMEMDEAQAGAVAYQRAYYSVTASARQTKFETETTEELDRMIQDGATVEDIEGYMNGRAKEFIEETGDLFEQPDVKRQVGERLMRWSHATNTRASSVLKEKTDRELLDLTTGEVQASLARGESVDVLATVERLKQAGLDGVVVQDEVVNAIGAYALRTGDVSVLHALDDVRRPEDVALEIDDLRASANAVTLQTETIDGSPLPSVGEPEPKAPSASTYIAPINMDRITSGMGERRAPIAGASTNHGGLDIAAPVGTPVVAPAAGRVTFAGPRGRGGNTVIIEHADGTTTGYAHLSIIHVEEGQQIDQGFEFAATGNTGNSTGPHLHLTARRNGKRIDPRSIIGQPTGDAATDAGQPEAEQQVIEAAPRQRAPGASVLTSAQQMRVMNWISQVEGENDRRSEQARVEAKDELTLDLWERSSRGEDVSEIIQSNVRTGVLEPSEGMTMTNAFKAMRNDQLEGDADDDLVLRYAARFAVSEPNYGAIMSSLDRDYNAGRFGTGRAATRAYLELKTRAANGSRADRAIPPEEKRAATVARGYVGGTLGSMIGEGALATPEARRMGAEAMIDWERRVAGGQNPMTAADAVIAEYTPRIRPSRGPSAGASNSRAPGQTGTAVQTQTAASTAQTYNYIPGRGMVAAD